MTVLAESGDVVRALRRALSATETTYAPDAIAEASDLVLAHLGRATSYVTDWPTDADVPGAVTRVVARMVARVFQQDDGRAIGASQDQKMAGPFQHGVSFTPASTTGAPWLAASDKITLRPYRAGGGMTSVAFASERGYDCGDFDDDCEGS